MSRTRAQMGMPGYEIIMAQLEGIESVNLLPNTVKTIAKSAREELLSRARRIEELEADLKIADDMGHDLDEKLHHAEATLREVIQEAKENPGGQSREMRAILTKYQQEQGDE